IPQKLARRDPARGLRKGDVAILIETFEISNLRFEIFEITNSAPAGERKLARGERSEPPVEEEQRYAPRQGLQELPAPLPGRVGHLRRIPGVRKKKRSPLAKFLPLLRGGK